MKFTVLLILFFSFLAAFAQPKATEKYIAHPLSFIENKGQITDQNGSHRNDIQYKVAGKGISVFVGKGHLHYQFSRAENKHMRFNKFSRNHKDKADTIPTCYTMYRLDMDLEGANPNPQVIAEEKQAYYENYHTTALQTDCPEDSKVSDVVSTYNKVTYKNIYPHIDWTLYLKNNQLEYDFVVNPGGNVNDIKINYSGATDIAHNKENIKIKTPFGDVNEQNLYAYEKGTGKLVIIDFLIHNNKIEFSVPKSYNPQNSTLVIDPQLAWGTYYGGNGEDITYNMTCNNAGIITMCGATTSLSNIATTGAYQTICNGNYDAFLARFNSAGTLLWASYYGGAKEDDAYGLSNDKDGNIYISGLTYSSNSIATVGSYQDTLEGTVGNGFLAKFNNTGTLEWATYYNGESKCIKCDTNNNIYFCGGTTFSNHVATIGCYQDTLAGTGNTFLAKFNTSGTIVWSTYFGLNTGTSSAYSCILDNNNNICIAGIVYDNGIYVTPDCYKSTDGYGDHSFIAKFDSSCHLKWSTYFGGDSTDYTFAMACDDSLNVYITGLTNSNTGIATPGAHQAFYGGGYYDAFLAKFNDTGALQWSTYYGGGGNDEGNGIACDHFGNIFLAGMTGSTNNIATPDGYQIVNSGGLDAFLAVFNYSGTLSWATYYGGSNNDIAYGAACDGIGNVYISGGTASTDYIATPGSYQSVFADSTDAFLVKFDTASAGIRQLSQHIMNVSLYPSPNNGNFWITGLFEVTCNDISIEILNEQGQVVYNLVSKLQNGVLKQNIEIPSEPGIYFLKAMTGNENKTLKFLIE